ncbi:putative 2-aminoethylphosphonate ABC transporter substrate-binding protein [Ruminiclostridium cellobioparum]|uniref:Extracellular solute-binding protein n=1 Tax=Ruminiclostridium cellobioparum subsp. termitidis CT1112 TaxID=1195236 RepID=S0FH83_RUMCE|nr:putative 2-aminoethylphosphonate ABC transporter substrate-binding protein [Ruminiclostridium cellobioparum]EMS70722.1 extracellular solute-binding protein [Ruminiclostridium cellobioparum subsp. termitidis CT1112]
MKRRILTYIVSVLLLTGSIGTLNGCGQQQTQADAAKGDITVYTALEDEQVTEYLAAFNKKYPDIKVNTVRESTGTITAKLLAEKENPQADLVWGTAASSMMVLDNQGMLEPYAPTGVERILPKFKSDKKVPTWVGNDVWETAIVVNTVEAKKLGLPEIKSYQDLLKPEFKGHIVMSNPNSSGTGFLTVSAALQLNGKDSEKGWEYLDKLHENISQYVHSGSKPAKMAAAGETAVGISFGYAGISQKSKGAPVEVIFPTEGSGWDLEANALMKKDDIKPAAKTFLNWAISDDAMNLYKANYPIIATGEGGKYEGFAFNPVDQLIDNDFSWASENRDNILKKWMEKYDSKSAPKE